MASAFDPALFMEQQFDGVNDTKIIPCPTGEFPGISDKVEVVQWSSEKKGTSGLKLRVLWDIQDDSVRQLTGRDKVIVPQDVMLDLTDTGALDMGKGKNVRLGRLREALDLNTPGEPFSFGMIQGRVATVNVKHRPGDNPEDIFAEVDRVAKPA